MKLIVGLGNPGASYLMTRHNVGFMVIDALSKDSFMKKHQSLIQKITLAGEPVLLVKPQIYMNCSGEAVRDLMAFYKIPPQDLLVIQDDVDQPFLNMKFQKSRGHGGHRGIQNIHDSLKTPDYVRLKLGVGRPHSSEEQNPPPSTSDYVLAPFSKKEQTLLKDFLKKSVQAVLCFIEEGFEKAAGEFNRKTNETE